MQKRQQFTAEFKREAVRLFKAGDRPAAVVAPGLGILRNRLYKWAQDLEKKGATAFAGSGRPTTSGDELAPLKRDNVRLKEENAILKKAAAYFAREVTGLGSGRNGRPGSGKRYLERACALRAAGPVAIHGGMGKAAAVVARWQTVSGGRGVCRAEGG